MQDVRITVSTASLFKFLGFILVLGLMYMIRDILLLIFVSLIFAALIDPFAHWMQKKSIPRALAVLCIYIIVFGVLGLTLTLLYPVIVHDVPQFFSNLTKFWQDIQHNPAVERTMSLFGQLSPTLSSPGNNTVDSGSPPQVQTALTGIFSTVTGVFGSIFSFVLVLVMTFYMVVQDDPSRKVLKSFIPDEYVPRVSELFHQIRDKLGAWLRGQMVLSVIVGMIVFIGLALLGVPYAAVLGLLAGILEFVPYIGPIFAAVPALLIAFTQGGVVKFALVLAMYIVFQQFENHVLVPKVMQRAVGLNPLVSIIAILVGAKLAGVVGALLAIPVATALSVCLQEVMIKKQRV